MSGRTVSVLSLVVGLFSLVFALPQLSPAATPTPVPRLEMWFVWANGSSGTGTLLRGHNGTIVLFDEGGGASWANYCKDLMDAEGISTIHYAIGGHYDIDHVGGMDNLNDLMGGDSTAGSAPNIDNFYDRGGTTNHSGDDIRTDYYDLVSQSGKRSTVVLDGSSDIDLGGNATLRFLSVGSPNDQSSIHIRGQADIYDDVTENNKSISALVTFTGIGAEGGFDLYLGSDLEGTGEEAVDDVIVTDLGGDIDIMLVDHHGADTFGISGTEFLQTLDPEMAIISVWDNAHGHPSYNTIQRLQNAVEHDTDDPDDQRIFLLTEGDTGDWPDQSMLYCHVTDSHVYITTDSYFYTVIGSGIDDPDLDGHEVDQGDIVPTPPPTPIPSRTPTPTYTPTSTPSVTPTPTPTPTYTPTPSVAPTVHPVSGVVVNQIHPFSVSEYVELYNNNTTEVLLDGCKLNVYAGDYTFTSADTIPAKHFFLIADTNPSFGVTPDVVTGIGISNNGINSYVQLLDGASQAVDTVGWATVTVLYEGTKLATVTSGKCWLRHTDGVDTDDNAADFYEGTINPRNKAFISPTPAGYKTPPPTTPTPKVCIDEGFDDFHLGVRPTGWTFANCNTNGDTYTTAGSFGAALPSVKLNATGDIITTETFFGCDELKLWLKGQGTDATSALLVEEYYAPGVPQWTTTTNINNLPTVGTVISSVYFSLNSTQLRFAYTKSVGDLAFDDVEIAKHFPTSTPTATPPPTVTPTPTPIPVLDEGFDGFHTGTRPAGWTFTNCNDNSDTYTTSGYFGRALPSIRLDATGDIITTSSFSNGSELSLWLKTVLTGNNYLLVEEYYSSSWNTVTTISNFPTDGSDVTGIPIYSSTDRLKFSFFKLSPGNLRFDDVIVYGP